MDATQYSNRVGVVYTGDGSTQQSMLASLRTTFNTRVPGGLTPQADARLQRTLSHYTREVTAAHGVMDEKEILRQTYDSMVGWFRRNTQYLVAAAAAAPAMYDGEVADPMALFGKPSEPAHAVQSTPLSAILTSSRSIEDPIVTRAVGAIQPAPVEMPAALQAIETRPPKLEAISQQLSVLQKQEDVVKYREVEHNLVLNSKDRNWLLDTKENRYNFSVLLDSSSRPQGTGPQPTIMNRFRNIVRVELVKVILPVEALDVVLPKECTDTGNTTDYGSAFYSVLGMPSINVVLNEYQGNTFGTNDGIDRAFAVCQYDATWRTDAFQTNTNTSRGFALFFPKFMKAQRVYAPAPLASFQKLSFQLTSPENQLLSCAADAFQVRRILFSTNVGASCYGAGGASPTNDYLFIQTKEYFPAWAFSQLDKVLFAGLTFTSLDPNAQAGGAALIEWLQRDQGHIVTAIGNGSGNNISDGANAFGYANAIIIRNRTSSPDPMTGVVALEPFSPDGNDFTLSIETGLFPAEYQDGAVLNVNRQVQVTLRVITREMDSATNIRPDNI